ncbi:hypothetical protein HDU99_008235 [Rhizoclosmatium hyalinum]|nr:hypothetical protein HDU99_008235 [Rhizoclosmatium hyalinum]
MAAQSNDRGIWQDMSHLQRFGAEVAVVGAGYLAYDQWRKHNNKQHSAQSENEYKQYTATFNQSQAAPWLQPGGGVQQQQYPQQGYQQQGYQQQQQGQGYNQGYNQQQQPVGPPPNIQGQLPPGWEIKYSTQYQTNFYHNIQTGENTWTFPTASTASSQPQGPPPGYNAPQVQVPQGPPPQQNWQQPQGQGQYQVPPAIQNLQPQQQQQQGGLVGTWQNMSHLQRFGTEVAVAGAGYLAYEAWLKHSGKQHSREAEAQYQNYTRGI